MEIKSATIENACAAARVVFVPYFGKEVIEDICSFIRGDKVLVDPGEASAMVQPQAIEPPMSVAEAVELTGLTPQCLSYHARKGRIRRAHIKGAARSIGYVAADIRAIVQGEA